MDSSVSAVKYYNLTPQTPQFTLTFQVMHFSYFSRNELSWLRKKWIRSSVSIVDGFDSSEPPLNDMVAMVKLFLNKQHTLSY